MIALSLPNKIATLARENDSQCGNEMLYGM
jgi:hypothetical protein